jgi:undecaprenyl-diphosphatase
MFEALMNFDSSALLFIQETLRSDFLNGIMRVVTHLGDNGYIWILLGIILFIPPKTRRSGFDLLVCLALAYVLNDLIIKPLVARVRPFDVIDGLTILVKAPSSYSFPSGHTNASFAAAYALTRAFGKKGAWSYILAVLIAFSRCYVGVHYPTDVLAGMAVGTASALLAYWLSKKYVKTNFVRKSE